MTKTAARKKDEKDFKDRKRKVGKKKLKPVSATTAEVHAATLFVRKMVSTGEDETGNGGKLQTPTTHRGLTWKQCALHMRHYSYKVQRDGLLQLHSLLKDKKLDVVVLCEVLQEVCRLAVHSHNTVRKAALAVLRIIGTQYGVESDNVLEPFAAMLLKVSLSGLTHIDKSVRADAVAMTSVVLISIRELPLSESRFITELFKAVVEILPGMITQPVILETVQLLLEKAHRCLSVDDVLVLRTSLLQLWSAYFVSEPATIAALKLTIAAQRFVQVKSIDVRNAALYCFQCVTSFPVRVLCAELLSVGMDWSKHMTSSEDHPADQQQEDDLVTSKIISVASWIIENYAKRSDPMYSPLMLGFMFCMLKQVDNASNVKSFHAVCHEISTSLCDAIRFAASQHDFTFFSTNIFGIMEAYLREEQIIVMNQYLARVYSLLPYVLFKIRYDVVDVRRDAVARNCLSSVFMILSQNVSVRRVDVPKTQDDEEEDEDDDDEEDEIRLRDAVQKGLELFFFLPSTSNNKQPLLATFFMCKPETQIIGLHCLYYCDNELKEKIKRIDCKNDVLQEQLQHVLTLG
eukprot:PhF_6_TR26111/c0_g1_i1/m.36931